MLVPVNFHVPHSIDINPFHLTKLVPAFALIDYEAVMNSRERLRTVFNEKTVWPADNMSLKDNISDLIRHEKEFNEGAAFVYSIFDKDKINYIGCLYIEPSGKISHDCAIYMWVTDNSMQIDKTLFSKVKKWIDDYWPFENPAYPGREISWSEWKLIH